MIPTIKIYKELEYGIAVLLGSVVRWLCSGWVLLGVDRRVGRIFGAEGTHCALFDCKLVRGGFELG